MNARGPVECRWVFSVTRIPMADLTAELLGPMD